MPVGFFGRDRGSDRLFDQEEGSFAGAFSGFGGQTEAVDEAEENGGSSGAEVINEGPGAGVGIGMIAATEARVLQGCDQRGGRGEVLIVAEAQGGRDAETAPAAR